MDAILQERIRAAGHKVGKVIAAIREGRVFIEDFVNLNLEDTKDYLDARFATPG
jgi:hypothetical protein